MATAMTGTRLTLKWKKMKTNIEIVSIDQYRGSFLLRVNDLDIIPKVLAHIEHDSPIEGDEHNAIVIGSNIAVETDCVGRASSLANELKEKFNQTED